MKPCRTGAADWLRLFLLALPLLSIPGALAQTSNGVLREVYLGIGGGAVADLTSHPNFPNTSSLETIQPTFEAPSEFAENYGQRMRALLLPPTTGNYVFWIATDDGGALFLSTTENPAQRTQIAAVAGWTSSREWTKEPGQQSAAIPLVGGQRYYIEALQKEGGGGDNLAVRWQLPSGVIEEPIPNNRLIVYGLTPPLISQQPINTTVIEGSSASFTVRLQRMLGATFQWYRGGIRIPEATNATYTLGPLTLADHGSSFYCAITNSLGGTNSATAILSVLADTTKPTVSTVGNLGDPQIVFIVFSEPMEELTATNAANYAISGGINVTRAAFGVDARTIILTTTPMAANVTYTLTINSVRDRATTPNAILANTQRTFSLVTKPIDVSYLSLPREPIGPSSRRHGVVISEVMYHPTNRLDGRNLEFIEVYNSQPWFEELAGWRISGAIDFTFPSNFVLAARSFVVVAASPTDFRTAYSFTNVLGPFANSNGLQNSSGTLRLRNARDAVVFEMNYNSDLPYPVAADGGGPSLILARPSYGERDPRAWAASDAAGGTPGSAADTGTGGSYRTIVINEVLAHTDLPQVDYIELFNQGTTPLSVSGCILTDDPDTNKFVITSAIGNTIIPGRGFLVLTEAQLGFSLSSGGETIFFKHPSGRLVIDALRFEAQENGVPLGRFPDGAASFSRLIVATPGTNNAPLKPVDVVINEIMFDPISGDGADEFVELFNRGTNAVNLGGWRLRGGISYNIPNGTTLAAGGYLVIARDAARLRTNYAGLTTANCLGNFSGALANGGDRIELNFPDQVTGTNALGQPTTNTIRIPIDEVRYGPGGRWGRWAGGGGSSLELRDARSDNRLAPNWADSDDSARSPWVTVEATGTMDNGWADATQLHVTLLGAGEALIDNIEIVPTGSTNVVGNGAFESGAADWVFQGNHNQTSWEAGEGFSSSRSLHLRATGRGDSGANRVRTQLPFTLAPGTVVTMRAKVRWLKGSPNLLLRLRGNWMEASGYILATKRLGTPGAVNSRAVPNAGPAITDVRHDPPCPAASQPVLVVARVNDPDGLAFLAVHYRIDPATNYTTLAMTNNGAGLFSTVIPGQATGVGGAFYVQAADGFAPSASSVFPDNAPLRECVVRWGDNTLPGTLGTYRFWITQTNVNRWAAEEKMSNNAKDVTFIHGTNRVIYNAGAWFHGSPYHSPGYDSPLGVSCDYDLGFPVDDPYLGETDINLFRPGNGGGDATAQAEVHGYWFGGQLGVPFLYHRPVFVFVNGQRRETVFHDAQQPNGDFIDQWFPDDAGGDLHKIQIGFEFGDLAYGASEPGFAGLGATLNRYPTTGGVKKQGVYRATWPRRSAAPQELLDYTNIFNLVEVALTNAPIGSDAYTLALTNAIDVEEWFKVHVTQHLYNNGDSFSYGGGQNAFAYKPEHDTWKLFLWDVDFAFGGDPNDSNLTGIGGADHGPRNDHPPFARLYWQALIEAANGMMTAARSNPILDARYNGMVAGGAAVGSPQYIKDFIATKRNVVLNQIAANQSPFAITSNGGADFTTNRNLITLSGTAPLEVRTLLINGVAYPVTWTSLGGWTIRIPLLSGTNTLVITALNPKGAVVAGVTGTLRVNYTGANERPQDKIVINEIMYNPPQANAGYVELHNTSAANAFDLSGWRLNGIDFDFPAGSIIEPGAFQVVVKDRFAFALAYNLSIPIVGEFPGQLDNGGETLTLLQPGISATTIDQVSYDDDLPWPAAADGAGSSLQLIDPLQDNERAANWMAVNLASTNPPQALISITNLWRYHTNSDLTLSGWTAPSYNDATWSAGLSLLYYETAALPAPKNTALALGRNTYYFRTHFTLNGSPAGASLKLSTVTDDGAVFYLNGQEIYRQRMAAGPVAYATLTSGGVGDAVYEGPFILPGTALLSGDNVLAVEVHQSSVGSSDIVFGMTLETSYDVITRFTPGAANSVRDTLLAFPPLWLNEVLPNNFFLGTNGIADRLGEREPWVELYNGGSNSLSLAGYSLANNYTNLAQWFFPSNVSIGPKQFLLVWLDGEAGETETNELHASFRAMPEIGSVVLAKGTNLAAVIDHLNYSVPVAGRSHGSFPEGTASARRDFSIVTPGASNNPTAAPIDVRLNEWMADNTSTLADPDDEGSDFEDWFELFNPGTNTVDLTGCYLSDTLTNATHWAIPSGTTIAPLGYLLVWADNEPTQNSPNRADLHAGFSLAKGGEAIALFAADGTVIDAISFGAQFANVSQGRFPDGTASIALMTNATPRLPNFQASLNTPPTLALIGDRTIGEGALLTFTCVASDTNVPAQSLAFSLVPGAPAGAAIHATNGVFTWTPAEADGPGVYSVGLRVTDNGTPSLSATQMITITVHEVNNAPTLAPLNSRTIAEGSSLSVTNTATDPDADGQSLSFSLDPGAPANASVDPSTGIFSWKPSEDQGPANYAIVIRVTDNGEPPLSATETLNVFVSEVNIAPELAFTDHRTVHAHTMLAFTAVATDVDLPAQLLTFSLKAGGAPGATIDAATGAFAWTPDTAELGTNVLTVRVSDSGSPSGLATRDLTVVVLPSFRAEISRNGAMVSITFPTISGRSYRVDYKDNLADADWTAHSTNTVATTDTLTVPDNLGAQPQRFYRVVQVE